MSGEPGGEGYSPIQPTEGDHEKSGSSGPESPSVADSEYTTHPTGVGEGGVNPAPTPDTGSAERVTISPSGMPVTEGMWKSNREPLNQQDAGIVDKFIDKDPFWRQDRERYGAETTREDRISAAVAGIIEEAEREDVLRGEVEKRGFDHNLVTNTEFRDAIKILSDTEEAVRVKESDIRSLELELERARGVLPSLKETLQSRTAELHNRYGGNKLEVNTVSGSGSGSENTAPGGPAASGSPAETQE